MGVDSRSAGSLVGSWSMHICHCFPTAAGSAGCRTGSLTVVVGSLVQSMMVGESAKCSLVTLRSSQPTFLPVFVRPFGQSARFADVHAAHVLYVGIADILVQSIL